MQTVSSDGSVKGDLRWGAVHHLWPQKRHLAATSGEVVPVSTPQELLDAVQVGSRHIEIQVGPSSLLNIHSGAVCTAPYVG